jgi:hypothetical protein
VKDGPPTAEEEIRAARRLLEGHPHTVLVGQPQWWPKPRRWAVSLRLRVESPPSATVPTLTDWFVAVEPCYPWGEVDVLPARTGGIQGTFPHQLRNAVTDLSLPWTAGKVCVVRPTAALDRLVGDDEPIGHPERLLWTVNRTVEWLRDAAAGTLARPGEPFELPHFTTNGTIVAFCEGSETLSQWRGIESRFGTAELVGVGTRSIRAVREFRAPDGASLVKPRWGRLVEEATGASLAAWVRLDAVPVRPPFESPGTWGELFEVLSSGGLEPEDVLRAALRPLRDGGRHVLLVGFPIAATFGDPAVVMHWQPLELPVLTGTGTKGFGKREEAHWLNDLLGRLKPNTPLVWLEGHNWHGDVLQARGRADDPLRRAKVLVVGCGALGSAVAELMVREGVNDLQLLDPDLLEAGNLVRHTLTLDDVCGLKASRLAARLNKVSPLARVTAIDNGVPGHAEILPRECEHRDVIVDCTGTDWALHSLSTWSGPARSVLVSLSMGIAATRLFAFVAPGSGFEFRQFRELMQPWLRRDRDEHAHLQFPRAGAGCWQPVFPAKCGEVWLHAAAAMKIIAHFVANPPNTPSLRVLEQRTDASGITTVREGVADGQ